MAKTLSEYKRYLATKDDPKQPDRCKGCVWGKWEGSKQFCSKTRCVKEWSA